MFWIFLLGAVTGCRTMTATAVLCWFAYLKLLPQEGWTFWANMLVSAVIFGVMALGEYGADLYPKAPSRTDLPLMASRLAFGAIAGTLAARGVHEPAAGGILLGVLGAYAGAHAGLRLRLWGGKLLGRDWPVGIVESAVVLWLAIVSAQHLAANAQIEASHTFL